MKTLTNILFVCFLLCTNSLPGTEHPALSTQHSALILADSLMHVCPDTALQLLQAILPDTLPSAEQRAHYALLLTRAHDKNYLTHTSDSLILTAMRHYNHTGNTPKQALSHYYLGSVYRDMNKLPAALEAYHKAMDYAKACADERLMGRVYNNVGHLYYAQRLFERADSMFTITKDIALLQNDTSLWIEAYAMQGEIKLYQGQYIEAERILQKAMDVLCMFEHEHIKLQVCDALSALYSRMRDGKKALFYAKLHAGIKKNGRQKYRNMILMGEAYYKLSNLDSAAYYFQGALNSPKYTHKCNAYMRLADIAMHKGDSALSLKMERQYSAYKDSLNQTSLVSQLVSKEDEILLQKEREKYELIVKRYVLIGVLLILFVLLILILLYRVARKHYGLRGKVDKQLHLLQLEKRKYVQIKLKESDTYAKMHAILDDCKTNGFSKDDLNDAEWLDLQQNVDEEGFLTIMELEYGLMVKEKRLCILMLIDFSSVDRANLLKVRRQTIYRMENEILKKMGENYEAGKLKKLLNERVNKSK